MTLKIPGRTPNRVVKTQIREHEAWKLQQVNCCEYIFAEIKVLDHCWPTVKPGNTSSIPMFLIHLNYELIAVLEYLCRLYLQLAAAH